MESQVNVRFGGKLCVGELADLSLESSEVRKVAHVQCLCSVDEIRNVEVHDVVSAKDSNQVDSRQGESSHPIS